MFLITCLCGHAADYDMFSQTSSRKPLPRNEYQCPRCFRAWRIEAIGEGRYTEAGMFIPPDKLCRAILPRL